MYIVLSASRDWSTPAGRQHISYSSAERWTRVAQALSGALGQDEQFAIVSNPAAVTAPSFRPVLKQDSTRVIVFMASGKLSQPVLDCMLAVKHKPLLIFEDVNYSLDLSGLERPFDIMTWSSFLASKPAGERALSLVEFVDSRQLPWKLPAALRHRPRDCSVYTVAYPVLAAVDGLELWQPDDFSVMANDLYVGNFKPARFKRLLRAVADRGAVVDVYGNAKPADIASVTADCPRLRDCVRLAKPVPARSVGALVSIYQTTLYCVDDVISDFGMTTLRQFETALFAQNVLDIGGAGSSVIYANSGVKHLQPYERVDLRVQRKVALQLTPLSMLPAMDQSVQTLAESTAAWCNWLALRSELGAWLQGKALA